MKDKAQNIVDDFLRSTNPALKRNALTFLRVVGDEESVRLLVNQATGGDESLREVAVKELSQLTAEARTQALAELTRVTTGADRERARHAYELLGRLGARAPAGPLSRTRLAWSLHRLAIPRKGPLYYIGATIWSLVAAEAAGLALLLYIAAVGLSLNSDGDFAIFGLGPLALLLAAPVLVIRACPYRAHPNRLVGAILECGFPALCVAAVTGVIAALVVQGPMKDEPNHAGLIWMACSSLALTTAAVRLGTALASGSFWSSKGSFWVSAAAGGCLGSLVFTGSLLLDRKGAAVEYWAPAVVACFGLAVAFARIDCKASGLARQSRVAPRYAAGAMIVLFLGACVVPIIGRNASVNLSKAGNYEMNLRTLPSTVRFSISQQSTVLFGAVGVEIEVTDLVGKQLTQTKAGYAEKLLDPGDYRARAYLLFDDSSTVPTITQKALFGEVLSRAGIAPGDEAREQNRIARIAVQNKSEKSYPLTFLQPLTTSREISVPQLPFVYFFEADRDLGIVHVELDEDLPLGKELTYSIYHNGALTHETTFEAGTGEYAVIVSDGDVPAIDPATLRGNEVTVQTHTILGGVTLRILAPAPFTELDRATSLVVPVSEVPYSQVIQVGGRRTITFSLPQSVSSADYTLELYDARGKKLEDDDESISMPLAPGVYVIHVAGIGMGAERAKTAPKRDDVRIKIDAFGEGEETARSLKELLGESPKK